MTYGIVNQALVALRSEPFKRSEMVSQLLFGELFSIVEKHKEWLRVVVSHDQYEGWIDSKGCERISEDDFEDLHDPSRITVATRLFSAQQRGEQYPVRLCPGTPLYNFNPDNGSFSIPNAEYKTFSIPNEPAKDDYRETIVERAFSFINAPYLWGGRSPYGVDCSGLIQILFKTLGFYIPRDASQQVELGEIVGFISQAEAGDLAFFDNEEGVVTHVGLVIPDGRIVHSSGSVRVDQLDHQGIYCARTQSYTHKLRVIKNLLADLT